MINRRITKLADVVEVVPGTWGDDIMGETEPIYAIKVSDIKTSDLIDFDKATPRSIDPKTTKKCVLQNQDLLVVKSSGSASNVISGKAALFNYSGLKQFVGTNFLLVLRADRTKLDPAYLFYLATSKKMRQHVLGIVSGSTYPNIKVRDYLSFEFPLPSLNEQQEMVAILSSAHALRKKREEADQKMATFAPALFHQMFGDPTKNERGWEMKKLKDVARVSSGAGFPLQEQGNTIESHPFFKVGDMNSPENKIELVVAHNYVSESTAKKLKAEIFPTGSIAFPKIGAAIATDKKRILHQPSCVDNNVMVVIPKEFIHPNYLFALFQTKRISDFSSSGTVPSIRKTTVEEWDIPIPPISIQKEYASQMAEFQLLAGKQNILRNRLDGLFNSLISSYL